MKLKIIKPTFKQHKYTGLSAIGAGIYIDVKVKGRICAIINGGSAFKRQVDIQIAVKVDSSKGWEWLFIRDIRGNINELKDKARELLNTLPSEYELHYLEK